MQYDNVRSIWVQAALFVPKVPEVLTGAYHACWPRGLPGTSTAPIIVAVQDMIVGVPRAQPGPNCARAIRDVWLVTDLVDTRYWQFFGQLELPVDLAVRQNVFEYACGQGPRL